MTSPSGREFVPILPAPAAVEQVPLQPAQVPLQPAGDAYAYGCVPIQPAPPSLTSGEPRRADPKVWKCEVAGPRKGQKRDFQHAAKLFDLSDDKAVNTHVEKNLIMECKCGCYKQFISPKPIDSAPIKEAIRKFKRFYHEQQQLCMISWIEQFQGDTEANLSRCMAPCPGNEAVRICLDKFFKITGYSPALALIAKKAYESGELDSVEANPESRFPGDKNRSNKGPSKKIIERRKEEQLFDAKAARIQLKGRFSPDHTSAFVDEVVEAEGEKFKSRTYRNDSEIPAFVEDNSPQRHMYLKAPVLNKKKFKKCFNVQEGEDVSALTVEDLAHGEYGKTIGESIDFDFGNGLIGEIRNCAVRELKKIPQLVHKVLSVANLNVIGMEEEERKRYMDQIKAIKKKGRKSSKKQKQKELACIVQRLEEKYPKFFDSVLNAGAFHVQESWQSDLSMHRRHRDILDSIVYIHQMSRQESFYFVAVYGKTKTLKGSSFDPRFGFAEYTKFKNKLGKADQKKLEVAEADFLLKATELGLCEVRIYHLKGGDGLLFDGKEYLHMSVTPSWELPKKESMVEKNPSGPKKKQEPAGPSVVLILHDMLSRHPRQPMAAEGDTMSMEGCIETENVTKEDALHALLSLSRHPNTRQPMAAEGGAMSMAGCIDAENVTKVEGPLKDASRTKLHQNTCELVPAVGQEPCDMMELEESQQPSKCQEKTHKEDDMSRWEDRERCGWKNQLPPKEDAPPKQKKQLLPQEEKEGWGNLIQRVKFLSVHDNENWECPLVASGTAPMENEGNATSLGEESLECGCRGGEAGSNHHEKSTPVAVGPTVDSLLASGKDPMESEGESAHPQEESLECGCSGEDVVMEGLKCLTMIHSRARKNPPVRAASEVSQGPAGQRKRQPDVTPRAVKELCDHLDGGFNDTAPNIEPGVHMELDDQTMEEFNGPKRRRLTPKRQCSISGIVNYKIKQWLWGESVQRASKKLSVPEVYKRNWNGDNASSREQLQLLANGFLAEAKRSSKGSARCEDRQGCKTAFFEGGITEIEEGVYFKGEIPGELAQNFLDKCPPGCGFKVKEKAAEPGVAFLKLSKEQSNLCETLETEKPKPCDTHLDRFNGVLLNLSGRKKVYLAPPALAEKLRKAGLADKDNSDYFSKVKPFSKENMLIPEAWKEVDLRAGDCLVIPEKWLHTVLSYEDTVGVSLKIDVDHGGVDSM